MSNDINRDKKNDHSDELYTITLFDQSEAGEKIPERLYKSERIEYDKKNDTGSKAYEPVVFKTREQIKLEYYARRGLPPVLSSSALIARQAYIKPPIQQNSPGRKSFIEQALEYADKSHEKTEHIPFMCYWPSYEYMSQAQLNWYFYMRDCIRRSEYIDTDLSYLFVYIYELINKVGVQSPEDGLDKLIDLWVKYRDRYSKLDRYLTEWVGDYISFYKCDAEKAIERLKNEGLFLLMPTDMLADYYFSNDLPLPIELISRFSDYKIYESEFIKGEHGILFTDHLASLINEIRLIMNQAKPGSFEKRDRLPEAAQQGKRIPFQRAVFHNPENKRIDTYLPYEQHRPFRIFITAIIKEFENQLRILTKYRGRLRPDSLPADIKELCKKYAHNAFKGLQPEKKVEITIDRSKLLTLMQDSDEVRKRLIEGNDEYEEFNNPAGNISSADSYTPAAGTLADSRISASDNTIADFSTPANNSTFKDRYTTADSGSRVGYYASTDSYTANTNTPADISTPADTITADTGTLAETSAHAGSSVSADSHVSSDTGSPAGNNTSADSYSAAFFSPSADSSSNTNSSNSAEGKLFRSKLNELQQRILDYLISNGLSSSSKDLGAAFPGVFVGVEIDKINDIALEEIGDVLIGFEDERWFVIEDYIDEI